MSSTRILTALLLLLAIFAPASKAQLGKSVMIPAGSDADHELNAISSADPSQKLALIDAFAKAHPESDFQIVADEQYVNYYINAKHYDKAFEYGDKLSVLDPSNYSNAVNMVRAAAEKGDLAKLFTYGEKANSIIQNYKASPAPEGTDANDWSRIKTDKLVSLRDNQDYVEEALLSGAYNAKDPGRRAEYFVRFAKMYPDTPEAEQALTVAASSYSQAQNRAKMHEVANSVLAKNPENIDLLLLLADDYSQVGEQLDKAETYAKKAISVADAAKKPDNISDEEWQKKISVQKGWALSSLGQVDLQKKLNAQAVDSLSKAAPLLKSNAGLYGRNQYRLGFAYLNMKKNPEATKAFTEAASVESPYKVMAEDKLSELGTSAKPTAHKKAS